MRIAVLDADYLKTVRPLDVAGYLHANGWTMARSRPQVARYWEKGTGYEALLPLDRQIDGFAERMADLLRTVERAEGVDQQAILNDVRDGRADALRVSVDGEDVADGTIGVIDGDNLVNASRGILWAAACSAVRPRAFYSRRRPAEANDLMRRVRLAQSEVGSYRVRLLTPIPPLPNAGQSHLHGMGPESAEPFERQTTQTLVRGLQAASQVAEGLYSLQDNADVDGLVGRGLNGNLCDSLSQLRTVLQPSTSIRVTVSWSWRRPQRADLPTQFAFGTDHLEAVSEIGRVLKEFVPQEEVEIYGTVVRLEREPDAIEGVAVVRAYFEDGVKLVRVSLGESDYSEATAAYESRALVGCFGDLTRQGRSYELRSPRAFRTVPNA